MPKSSLLVSFISVPVGEGMFDNKIWWILDKVFAIPIYYDELILKTMTIM